MSEKRESNGVQSTVQNLGSTFADDGSPPYSDMMPPASSPPHSYQVSAGYGGGDAPLTDSAPPDLKPSGTEPVKKKRGRPRKYAPDGTALHGVMSPPHLSGSSTGGSLSPTGTHAPDMAACPKKKSRGRPSGSGRKHQMAGACLGSAGAGYGFKPHVITIKAGEDVHAKLMSFSQNTSQEVCVMSASGAISNVTLRQPATSRGSVTYEGRFEILSLSGSFMFSEVGGEHSRTGRLSVSLAGPDGNVIGGGVAGLLIAAAPVQVILGCFSVVEVEQVQKKPGHLDGLVTPTSPGPLLVSGAKSPPSFGSLSPSSGGGGGGGPASPPPLNQHHLESSISSPPGVASFPWR